MKGLTIEETVEQYGLELTEITGANTEEISDKLAAFQHKFKEDRVKVKTANKFLQDMHTYASVDAILALKEFADMMFVFNKGRLIKAVETEAPYMTNMDAALPQSFVEEMRDNCANFETFFYAWSEKGAVNLAEQFLLKLNKHFR